MRKIDTTGYNHLRTWLPPLILKTNLSIEQFAKKAGLGRSTLYGYMQDRQRPSTQVMARICHLLHVPLEEGLRQYTELPVGRPKATSVSRPVTARRT